MPKPHYRLNDKPPTYYHLKQNRAIICTTLRAGSTSMLKTMSGKPRVSQEVALQKREEGTKVILWLRHPLDRWASAADLFMRNRGWSLNQMVERTFEEPNRHWLPQTQVHSTGAGIFVPNLILPFETLNETWPEYCRGFSLGVWNVTKQRKSWEDLKQELNDGQISQLMWYYSDDITERMKLYD